MQGPYPPLVCHCQELVSLARVSSLAWKRVKMLLLYAHIILLLFCPNSFFFFLDKCRYAISSTRTSHLVSPYFGLRHMLLSLENLHTTTGICHCITYSSLHFLSQLWESLIKMSQHGFVSRYLPKFSGQTQRLNGFSTRCMEVKCHTNITKLS